jgi:Zn-dependent oligopeptidase
MLPDVLFETLASTAVFRDFVELYSQFYEHCL